MDQMTQLNPIGSQFLKCLERARHIPDPFDYWLLAEPLPSDTIDQVVALPFAPPATSLFDGRRESNNSTRHYFSKENQARFEVCRDIADAFRHARIMAAIERITGADLADGSLRIEYCLDVDGFWLEPHVDISVKLFTMLIYLSDEPELRDAGTDIYDESTEHRLVASAPYERNKGLIFIPGDNTWHGFTQRPIRAVRRSLIINYVSPEWRSTRELA